MNKAIYIFIGIAVIAGIAQFAWAPNEPEQVSCTADAKLCPDGSYVGRSGPSCEFVCPAPEVPDDVQAQINEMVDMIAVVSPEPLSEVSSPLELSGEATGPWFFEASAPVAIVDWDGRIIAEHYVTAQGDWMTTNKVLFSGEITFESPYKAGDPAFMKKGTVIFKKDNPSGLPENDAALEIPIYFAPQN